MSLLLSNAWTIRTRQISHHAGVGKPTPIKLCVSITARFLHLADMLNRRLARRGGVKRIAATIYDDIRQALKDRLRAVSSLYVQSGGKLMFV